MTKLDDQLPAGPSQQVLTEKPRGTSQRKHGIGRYHRYTTTPEHDKHNAEVEKKRRRKLARRKARRKAK